MSAKRYYLYVLILGSLTALSPFSIDMYLPGFSQIASSLHVTEERVALTLSSYFIGLAVGQLLYGPLLDKFGRKKPLYIGLCVYIVASMACYFANDLNSLVAYRFVQAVGGCAASVAAMAMVRDIFPLNENAKVFALLMLVLGASPMLAPTAGGYVTTWFGWHAIFLALSIIAAVIFAAVAFILPDKFEPNRNLSLRPVPILKGFWEVLRVPQFFTYALAGAIGFAGLFAYVSAAPVIFMKIYHLNQTAFGWIFAGLSAGLIGAGQVNNLLLRRYRSEQIVPVALAVQLAAAAAFVIGSVAGFTPLWFVLLTVFIQLSCLGIAIPNTSALCIAPFERNAGTAAALLGFLQMGIGSLASTIISEFEIKTATPVAVIMAAAAALACLVFFIGRRFITQQVAATPGAVVAH